MAPEVSRDETGKLKQEYGPPADIFSLGLLCNIAADDENAEGLCLK